MTRAAGEMLADLGKTLQSRTVEATQVEKIRPVVLRLLLERIQAELVADSFAALVHRIRLLKFIEAIEHIPKIEINLGQRGPITGLEEDLGGYRVVLMGTLVLIQPGIRVRDAGAKTRVSFIVAVLFQPLFGIACNGE